MPFGCRADNCLAHLRQEVIIRIPLRGGASHAGTLGHRQGTRPWHHCGGDGRLGSVYCLPFRTNHHAVFVLEVGVPYLNRMPSGVAENETGQFQDLVEPDGKHNREQAA